MDFPRAAALGQTPQPPAAELKYVALGDSFSAGEGVPPFYADSATDGCHRSTRAYAELLDADSNLSLSLQTTGFVACSGATTTLVMNGQNGEDPQINALDTDTQLVTITIGGNDIGFVDFLVACINPATSCDTGSAAYLDKITNVLPGNVDSLYSHIKSKIGSATRVLVVGYPRAVPYDDSLLTCGILTSGERTAARNVIAGLNSAISAAVSRAGSQFEFVDADAIVDGVRISPFAGHEYCSSDSYFNGLEITTKDPHYVMHPNVEGQQAYERLIGGYLANHP